MGVGCTGRGGERGERDEEQQLRYNILWSIELRVRYGKKGRERVGATREGQSAARMRRFVMRTGMSRPITRATLPWLKHRLGNPSLPRFQTKVGPPGTHPSFEEFRQAPIHVPRGKPGSMAQTRRVMGRAVADPGSRTTLETAARRYSFISMIHSDSPTGVRT
jgi:hypothetical protein